MVRHAELKEQAESLPQGSAERKTFGEANLAPGAVPATERGRREMRHEERMFWTKAAKRSANRHSARKRMIDRRRGRPEEFTIKTRAAYEEKLAYPEKVWREIAAQFELKDPLELRRAVRRLKEVLKSEGIRIPKPEDYRPPSGSKSFFE